MAADRDADTREWAKTMGLDLVTIRRDQDAGTGSSHVTVQLPGHPPGRVGVGVGWSVRMPNGRHYRAGCELVAAVEPDLPKEEREAIRRELRARAEGEVVAELESLSSREFRAGDRSTDLTEDDYYAALIDDIDRAKREIVITSPFAGKRMDQLVEPLKRAAARGVEVVVLTKPENDTTTGATGDFAKWQKPRHWEPLRAAGVRVAHRSDKMHEKIAAIDGRVVYLGSQNPTSHKDTTDLTLRIESDVVAAAIATKYHPDTGIAEAERHERTIDDVGGGTMVSGVRWSSSAKRPGEPPPGLFDRS